MLVAQNGEMQLAGIQRGIGTQFLSQPAAQPGISLQRLGLLACRGARRHVKAVRTLVERVIGHGIAGGASRRVRITGHQQSPGQGVPGSAQQPAQLIPCWLRPGSIRFL